MRLLLLALLFLATSAAAADKVTITLRDGSVVRGEITAFVNQTYAVESPSLGRIQVHERDVASIRYAGSAERPQADTGAELGDLMTLQRQLMADPETMKAIRRLAEDPAIQQVLADPEISRAVASGDIQALMNNPRILELLKHPGIRDISEEVMAGSGER